MVNYRRRIRRKVRRARKRGMIKRGGRGGRKATRAARIVLSKVNYVPSEQKMFSTPFSTFTAEASYTNPDLHMAYHALTDGIAKGPESNERIGNEVFIKRVAWFHNWFINSLYTGPAGQPQHPDIHVFLIAVKCNTAAKWWTDTNSGSDVRPDQLNTGYRKLRSACTRIIRHWRLNNHRQASVATNDRDTLNGRMIHKFTTPFKIKYADTDEEQLWASNQLLFVVVRANDGSDVSWALGNDETAAFHNEFRVDYMG